MKYIILNDDNSVKNCLAESIDGSIPITDEEAQKFKNTIRHDELKLVGGVLVPNQEVIDAIEADRDKIKEPKPKETDRIWQSLIEAGINVPQDVIDRLT